MMPDDGRMRAVASAVVRGLSLSLEACARTIACLASSAAPPAPAIAAERDRDALGAVASR